MKEIDWDKCPIGTKFTAEITGIPTEGKIQKQGTWIYLCQNEKNGSAPNDKLGYNDAWTIANGSSYQLATHNVTNLKLELDGDFTYEAKIELDKNNNITLAGYKICNITISPFGNCQNLSIANFNNALTMGEETLYMIFRKIKFNKTFSVVDIQEEYKKYLPKDESLFVFETDYINTNGTKMCIMGINNSLICEYYYNKFNKKT